MRRNRSRSPVKFVQYNTQTTPTALTIADGTGVRGGEILVLDYIEARLENGTGTAELKLTLRHATSTEVMVFSVPLRVSAGTTVHAAEACSQISLQWPNGFPVVNAFGNPLKDVNLLPDYDTGGGGGGATITVGYHYRPYKS